MRDASADDLILGGAAGLSVNSTALVRRPDSMVGSL
jgi:hypothetical protein